MKRTYGLSGYTIGSVILALAPTPALAASHMGDTASSRRLYGRMPIGDMGVAGELRGTNKEPQADPTLIVSAGAYQCLLELGGRGPYHIAASPTLGKYSDAVRSEVSVFHGAAYYWHRYIVGNKGEDAFHKARSEVYSETAPTKAAAMMVAAQLDAELMGAVYTLYQAYDGLTIDSDPYDNAIGPMDDYGPEEWRSGLAPRVEQFNKECAEAFASCAQRALMLLERLYVAHGELLAEQSSPSSSEEE